MLSTSPQVIRAVLFVFLILPALSWSNPDFLTSMEEDLALAQEYLNAFHNDKASIILTKLAAELSVKKELNTPFGLKVQLLQAEALEKDHQDEVALEKLLIIAEKGEKYQNWAVVCNAHLSLARLFEKIDRWEDCLQHLHKAESLINQYQLNQDYPRFAIRFSSYHRLHGDHDLAIFFAQEVLRTAPEQNAPEHEAVGHMLMGMLLKNEDYEKAVEHFIQAGQTFKATGDITGLSYIHNNLSRLHFNEKKYKMALSYNDSTILASQQSIAIGHEKNWTLSGAYKFRGNIFRALEQHDSAWHYLNYGVGMEMRDLQKVNNDKVIEISARYKDEKKAQLIKEQNLLIKSVKQKRLQAIGMFLLILLFATILAYYYYHLRKANKKTVIQATQITEVNKHLSISLEQQIMLQGEVHHRVKNNLQVIISLLELQGEEIEDPVARKSLENMSNRIYSMAAIHEILYQSKSTDQVMLLDYTKTLCEHFADFAEQQKRPVFNLEIDNRFFNLETLMPLGIILNELLTNSLKYAGRLKNQLEIGIQLLPQAEGFCIAYRDNGPGFPKGKLVEREGGLGSYLLRSMSRQLNGRMETINDDGAVTKIYFSEKNA